MLFEQIPQNALKRISAEVKVDFKLASVTLRQADRPDPTRAAKLKIVERFIDSHHHVGTIQEPGNEYFRGQMDMQWGWLRDQAVWFHGNDDAQCVALGGSRRHLLGEQLNRNVESSSEATSLLVSIMSVLQIAAAGIKRENLEENSPGWAEIVYEEGLLDFTGIPKQRLDFLAIPLDEAQLQEPSDVHVVLGTPLYVALAR